jgi:hypothetical protein
LRGGALLEILLSSRVEGDVEDELGWIRHGWRPDAEPGEVIHDLVRLAKVDDLALAEQQQLIESAEHLGGGLMDGTQHCALTS